jgi:hypothetical protein
MDNNSSKALARTYRQNGLSIRDISQELKLPISTVHLWVKDIKLQAKQLQNLKTRHRQAMIEGQIKANLSKRLVKDKYQKRIMDQAKKLVGNVSTREIRLLCIALYWAEGFKKDSRMGFANSDPDMIKIFLKWLIEIEKIPATDIRLRVGINISHKDSISRIEASWASTTGIPLSQFQKPFFQKTKWKKTYQNSNDYIGVLRIRINNSNLLFNKIKGMIEGLKLI